MSRDLLLSTLMTVALPGLATAVMPVGEQNGLIQKYCAVCHTDAAKNGGLSLEHYDAARKDPGLAAMILSKLNNGAMGAAGKGVPDKAAQKAWLDSTTEQSLGAKQWHAIRENGTTTAGIVREVAPRKSGATDMPVYRLTLACDASGKGEVQLTWSPEPKTGRIMTVVVDGKQTLQYGIEGQESMGNGQAGSSGHASVILSEGPGGNRKLSLPKQSLTVQELFAGETVEFPFSGLEPETRKELEPCFR